MIKKIICSLFVISLLASNANSEILKSDTTETFKIEPDDPVVRALDSLAQLLYLNSFPDYIEKRASENFPRDFIPEYSDSAYSERIEQLNQRSPIDFTYNARVKPFIKLYAVNKRELTERLLGLAELHFPYFEEQLDAYNLPLELKYIAVIESALNPVARSHAGATGIWQFMLGTGRMYGLQVNSLVDERADVHKATEAACRHFKDLYNIYEDWFLAMAAYNAGPGNVNRAIRRAGGAKDFWAIRHFLPRETRNYVSAFIAATYVMEYAEEHNLYAIPAPYAYSEIDTLHIKKQLSFNSISELLDIPYDHIRYLNPSFRKGIIPYKSQNQYVLRLPKDYSGLFVSNEEKIYNYKTDEQIKQEELAAKMAETIVHVVRRGEVLGTIAMKHGTTVREIQQLNNLRGTMIRQGQRLVVRAPQPLSLPNISKNNNVHVVRSGESLSLIASKYNVSINELNHWNNLTSSKIYPGQNIIIKNDKDIVTADNDNQSEEIILDDDDFHVYEVDVEIEEILSDDTDYFLYIVKKGDTLLDIANKYEHISVEDIMEQNEIIEYDNLQEGRTLRIVLQ
ncbi:MAG: LysM peptidoglycan-binding domain-containing protein [Bacteroidales bacterium]